MCPVSCKLSDRKKRPGWRVADGPAACSNIQHRSLLNILPHRVTIYVTFQQLVFVVNAFDSHILPTCLTVYSIRPYGPYISVSALPFGLLRFSAGFCRPVFDLGPVCLFQPPENDLMRGERRLSEHELRFQRSLRNLNTPEWYKKSSTKPETALRKDYGSGSLAGRSRIQWVLVCAEIGYVRPDPRPKNV